MPDLSNIRKQLQDAILKMEQRISRYEEMAGPIAPDNAIGRVSRMDAINNRAVTEAAIRKAQEKLTGLKRHLDQVGQPDFAHCRQCGKEIPIQRILLAPESSFCVNCARK